MNEKEIGKRIEFIRKKEKLSRREFGKMINKSEDAVYNIEKARAKLNEDIDFGVKEVEIIGESKEYDLGKSIKKFSQRWIWLSWPKLL